MSDIGLCGKCRRRGVVERVPLNGIIVVCVNKECKNHYHTDRKISDNEELAIELWNKQEKSCLPKP